MIIGQIFDRDFSDVEDSEGVVCESCSALVPRAHDFSHKNNDLHGHRECIICNDKSQVGILIEEFAGIMERRLPLHYTIDKDNSEDSISMNSMIMRYTYDNERFLKILGSLISDANPEFFDINRKYRPIINAEYKERKGREALSEWRDIKQDIRRSQRFTNDKAHNFYKGLIRAALSTKDDNQESVALSRIESGKVLFRGRLVGNDGDLRQDIVNDPEKQLSAPPEHLTGNNRMSPPGISFMYLASDYETAISELRPNVGDLIAIGKFMTEKELLFFDFTKLAVNECYTPSIYSNPEKDEFTKYIQLTGELHNLISRPFRPTDTSYLDIQFFSEVIRNYREVMFDGIIFESSQRKRGLNYVVFGDYEYGGKKNYNLKFSSDSNVEFYRTEKVTIESLKLNERDLDE